MNQGSEKEPVTVDSQFDPPQDSPANSASCQQPAKASCVCCCKGRLLSIVILLAGLGAGAFWWYSRGDDASTSPEVGLRLPPDTDPDAESGAQNEDAPSHPLDPALKIAEDGLARIRREIRDYTAEMVKHERVGNELMPSERMLIKVRSRKTEEGRVIVPLSVYLKFLEPPSKVGREVIWIENRNEGKLVAHETGLANVVRLYLAPKGLIAMMGNRYPITDIGIENLVEKLIERGERDRQRDPEAADCHVQIRDGAEVDHRPCRMIEVRHKDRRSYYDFCVARIFIDKQLDIPVRYAAYTWPEQKDGELQLLEEYTYLNVKLNVGLTDADFDPDNPDYKYP